MQLKKFVFELSSLITDIEIDSNPNAKQVDMMIKTLTRLWWGFSDTEKNRYRTQISNMKERLSKIEIIDRDAEKIMDLKTDIEALETIIAVNSEDTDNSH